MWSASASESSGVIGPSSCRRRPRLSSRRVRSRGSSAISAGRPQDVHAGESTRGKSGGRMPKVSVPALTVVLLNRKAGTDTCGICPVLTPPRAAGGGASPPRGAAWSRAAVLAPPPSAASEPVAARRAALAQPLHEPLDAPARGSAPVSARPAPPPARIGPDAWRSRGASVLAESATDASTSKRASTLVSEVFACCPPGPLERETRSSISLSGMRDGARDPNRLTLHGVHSARRRRRPARLRGADSRRRRGGRAAAAARATALRYVTNNSTRPRARLAEELRGLGFARRGRGAPDARRAPPPASSPGKRVFALVMSAVVPDLEGLELVGDGADASCSAAATRRSSRTRSSAT